MNSDIQFLKELQQELKTQDNDCQAAPRFWVIGDYRSVPCSDECKDSYNVYNFELSIDEDINDFLKYVKEDELDEMSDEAKEAFDEIGRGITAIKWINDYYVSDEDDCVELIPVREERFLRVNTLFLTKAEAQEHIKLYGYNYSPRAHTYAMTAYRAPKVERLLEILETFDWEAIRKGDNEK